jgi:hypothetical protein
MRHFYLIFVLFFSYPLLAQDAPTSISTDYLKKSKSQKTAARVLQGTGAALMLISLLVTTDDVLPSDPDDKQNGKLADALGYTGMAMAIVSIPLSIASKKNKKKAVAISLRREPLPVPGKNGFAISKIPSIGIQFRL